MATVLYITAHLHDHQNSFSMAVGKEFIDTLARGGIYSEGPAASFESGHSYLQKIMQFHGVPSFEGIFVEGMAAMPDKAQSIKEKAITQAKELAKQF